MAAVVSPRKLRPSSSFRWKNCGLSWSLEDRYPDAVDGEEAREGTAAHHVATEQAEGRPAPVIGALAPNGYPIDKYMHEGAKYFVDDIRETLAGLTGPYQYRVETLVRAHAIIHPLCEGTPDAYVLSLADNLLVVWDYKYGHRFVDPYCNEQITCYVAGILEENGLTPADCLTLRVSFRVIQPRNYHPSGVVRVWNTNALALTGAFRALAAGAREAIKEQNLRAVTGEHCRDCNGRHACEAFARVAAYALDVAREGTHYELPPAAMGLELTRIKTAIARLEARAVGLEEQIMPAIRMGNVVPGWEIGRVNSRERWTVDPTVVIEMGRVFGADLAKADAITPNQARTALQAAGVNKEIAAITVAAIAEKPTGALRLQPADPDAAAKIFSK